MCAKKVFRDRLGIPLDLKIRRRRLSSSSSEPQQSLKKQELDEGPSCNASYDENNIPFLEAKELEDMMQGKVIGKGAYAHVHRITYKGKEAVLKVTYRTEDEAREAFVREVRALVFLDGTGGAPRILARTDWSSAKLALVEEFCPGKTFRSWLRDPTITDVLIYKMLLQIARQLEAIHMKNLIHNDIKGSNVIVDIPDNIEHFPRVHIIDFGLVREDGEYFRIFVNPDDNYYAPEVCKGSLCAPSSDVYCFGTLFRKALEKYVKDGVPEEICAIAEVCNEDDLYHRPPLEKVIEVLESHIANMQ
ncbi:hypothetical protein SK128_017132, partial [Halocaridina rubra]